MEPLNKVVTESALPLSLQFGILDLPAYTEGLARDLAELYQKLHGKLPEGWIELSYALDHPDMQSLIRRYQAAPAWRYRNGLPIEPAEGEPLVPILGADGTPLPAASPEEASIPEPPQDISVAPPSAPVAQPTLTLSAEVVAKLRQPKARISGLAGWGQAGQWLDELMNATPNAGRPDVAQQKRIDDAITAIANEAVRIEVRQVEVFLPYPDQSQPFSIIIGTWVHRIRQNYDGVFIRFLPVQKAVA